MQADSLFMRTGKNSSGYPVSYLLKLALADSAADANSPEQIRNIARKLLDHFTSDNTSPEIHSFFVVSPEPGASLGLSTAREASERFLLVQLLVQYANSKFLLRENGQRAIVFNSPHPPVHQKELKQLHI